MPISSIPSRVATPAAAPQAVTAPTKASAASAASLDTGIAPKLGAASGSATEMRGIETPMTLASEMTNLVKV